METYRVEDLPADIAARIEVNPDTGCWLWQGATNGIYGVISWQRRHWVVHRLVYTLMVGPIPAGLVLDHVRTRGCPGGPCCWPAHLEPTTPSENSRRAGLLNGPDYRDLKASSYKPPVEARTAAPRAGGLPESALAAARASAAEAEEMSPELVARLAAIFAATTTAPVAAGAGGPERQVPDGGHVQSERTSAR